MSDASASPSIRATRRDFLVTAAVSLSAPAVLACASSGGHASPLLAPASGGTILFQGDSITDAGRDRKSTEVNDARALGVGYPLLLAGELLGRAEHLQWHVYNRGISGNKVPDLQARWENDAIAIKPDLLSILVGVNDFWHRRLTGYTGTVADYEGQYTALLTDTRRALPSIRFVVLEPFVLRHGVVDDTWFPEFDERRAVAARVASRAGATFVPLQEAFNRRAAQTRPEDWTRDGVHPTLAGHALIAEHWRAATGL